MITLSAEINGKNVTEKKLYYKDPYITSFVTNLLKQEQDEEGRWYAVLEKTAFYPTGGGQPHDTGTIHHTEVHQMEVIDVEEIDGEIRHYLKEKIRDVTKEVSGQIDWNRRFDHMQQHAGQHILTAAFVELFDIATVSFHLGKETLTIDLDIEELTEEQAQAAEDLANQIILENRPIQTKWVSQDELSQYSLRKQLSVTDNIRLVIIPEFDYNGCGGTHPRSTDEVGTIAILGWEKQRKNTRVQFICGNRVRSQFHEKHKIVKELTGLLNAPEQKIISTAKRLLENGKTLEKNIEELQGMLIEYEAKALLANALQSEKGIIVSNVFQNRSIQEIQKLARTITTLSNESLVFFINEADEKLQFVCAKGSMPSLSMKSISANILPLINGKGGGNDLFAQGGGEAILTGEQLLSHMLKKID
ncbi:alanyl-tRNA editing protein [Bacillus sp. Bva_UNVM-123]